MISDVPEAVFSRTRQLGFEAEPRQRQLPNFQGKARPRQAIPRTRRGKADEIQNFKSDLKL